MGSITLSGIHKSYGTTKAVNGVDLVIEQGELFFLLGPSGCGKTTLLRMIAGFIDPTEGRIAFDDRDVTYTAPNRRNTGMVFQSYALWPHMTVAENVAYGLVLRKLSADAREAQVAEALAMVQMDEYAARKPNELSGGQQQRVALARALVVKPDVLLLDEPLSNLDAKLRLEMRTEIRRICKKSGITTVYVTHDQDEALSMADRIAVLKSGTVRQLGPPRDLYRKPATRFVAEFLGETNFVPAEVVEIKGDMVYLRTSFGELAAAVPSGSTPKPGKVTCSIRPEAFSRVDRPTGDSDIVESSQSTSVPSSGGNVLTGVVQDQIFLGDQAQHVVRINDDLSVRVLELNPREAPDSGEICLSIDPNDVVVMQD